MRADRQTLIDDLVGDLKPVAGAGRIGSGLASWLLLSTAYSVLIVLTTGPLRPGSLRNLVELPAFAAETSLAAVAIFTLAYAAMRSAVPAGGRLGRDLLLAAAPLVVWVTVYVTGFWYPAHPVSTLGARSHCHWQVALYSLPPLALMFYLARRQYPLRPRATAMLGGAAAASIPAALMQFGCMYEPFHILVHHMSPILLAAALGAVLGPIVLTVRRAVPRRRDASVH